MSKDLVAVALTAAAPRRNRTNRGNPKIVVAWMKRHRKMDKGAVLVGLRTSTARPVA